MRGWLLATTRGRNLALLFVWALCVGAPAVLLAQSQSRARRDIEQRFGLRASLTSGFASNFVQDLVARQRDQAASRLGGRTVSEPEFVRTVDEAGYGAAVLLDRHGRALRVFPAAPALLGHDLTRKYQHLREAVAGNVAVSKVVRSAARGVPVVAFAVPFQTPSGQRVYSGAYDISRTPLGSYLTHAIPIAGAEVYLTDPAGVVIASNGPTQTAPRVLGATDPGLARAAGHASEGLYVAPRHVDGWFAARSISGTPWRILVAAPASRVFESIVGRTLWLPWLVIVGFGVLGLVAVLLFHRLLASRLRLTRLNDELDRVARIDVLTEVHNRRHVEEALGAALSAARRHESSLSLLLLDIDRFKQFNDDHGHLGGDRALCHVASVIQASLRIEDILGRWGGEEFMVVLPGTDGQDAAMVAERLRQEIETSPIELSDGPPYKVTTTIGVVAWTGQDTEELIRQADRALYEGKAAGRNVVKLYRRADRESATPAA